MKQDETLTAIDMLAKGATVRETGKAIGKSPATVSRLQNKPEIAIKILELNNKIANEGMEAIGNKIIQEFKLAEKLQQKQEKFLLSEDQTQYMEVVDNKVVKSYDPEITEKYLTRVDKTQNHILTSAGVIGRDTSPSFTQYNIYNDNTRTLNSNVLAMIQGSIADIST